MYEFKKKIERYLRVNSLGPGLRLMKKKKKITGPGSYKGWETALNFHKDCAYVHDFLSRLKLRREHAKVHCLRGNRFYWGEGATNYDWLDLYIKIKFVQRRKHTPVQLLKQIN